MAKNGRGMSLAGVFWIVACGDIAVTLFLLLKIVTSPASQYDGIIAVLLLGFIVVLGAIMGGVALIRNPVAYGIGLALALVPPLYYGSRFVEDFVTTPSEESLEAGHGYFKGAANRAVADAIVAGEAAKVASLLPAANPNASGWNNMTFMRLALEDGHANPEIVAALLKAGTDPDQDSQLLFGYITGSDADVGVMVKEKNERLLRTVIATGIDLNQLNQEGKPRFFSLLKWPEGLALSLEHGANPEAEDKDGNTAIIWAVKLWYWPAIDVLLAHGARLDHIAHDGQGLHDAVREKLERYQRDRNDPPPQLSALSARLH